VKTLANAMLSIGKTVTRVCAPSRFALLEPAIFIPPTGGMAIEGVERKRARIAAHASREMLSPLA